MRNATSSTDRSSERDVQKQLVSLSHGFRSDEEEQVREGRGVDFVEEEDLEFFDCEEGRALLKRDSSYSIDSPMRRNRSRASSHQFTIVPHDLDLEDGLRPMLRPQNSLEDILHGM